MMIELCEPDLFWKFLPLLCPYCRWVLERLDEHVNLGDSSGQKLSVLHFHHSCAPAQITYGTLTDSDNFCRAIPFACPIPLSSTAMLLSWINHFTSRTLFVQGLNELIFFLLLSAPLLQFSLVWVSWQPFFPVSRCSYTDSEWQSLTLCWECWQQIVS